MCSLPPKLPHAIFVKGGVIRWMDGGGWKMEGGRVEGGSLVPHLHHSSTTPPKPEVSSPLPVAFAQPCNTLTAQIFIH